MLDIIICEDNSIQRLKIETIIINELVALSLDLNIVLSTDRAEAVLNHVKNNPEKVFIYFLDVDLDAEVTGIDLAKELRCYDSKGYIIFVTSHAELSFLTFKYKVQAFDYLLKSDSMLKTNISECLMAAYKDYENINAESKESIAINLGNRIENFYFDDILFFETTTIPHRLKLRSIKGHFEFYSSMKDIEADLPSYFYKCHRCYLVNTRKIKKIDKATKSICMINDEVCYCSVLYLKGLIKKCLI